MSVNKSAKSEECDCICHDKDKKIVHIVACCFICPTCQKRIKSNIFEKHLQNCPSTKTETTLT